MARVSKIGFSTQKITIIFVIIGIVFILGVRSSDSALPGDPNYFLDNFAENWQYVFANGPLDRVKLELVFANERLLEAKTLIRYPRRKNDFKEALTLMRDHIYSAEKLIQDERILGKNVDDLLMVYPDNSLWHIEVLTELYFQTPKQLQSEVVRDIEVSSRGYEESLKALPENKAKELWNQTQRRRDAMNDVLKEIHLPPLDMS